MLKQKCVFYNEAMWIKDNKNYINVDKRSDKMAENCLKTVLTAILLSCGVLDLLRKRVYLWVLAAGGLITAACIFFCNDISLLNRLAGVAVGAGVILLSFLSGGKIGLADGILLCITGLGLGFWSNMELFCLALMLAAGLSIILLALRKADRKKSIPFIPFMLAGYLIMIFTG